MCVKFIDIISVENAESAVNISQPKRRLDVKCCDSCVFNNRRDTRTYRSAKDLFEKRVFLRKYGRRKRCSRPAVLSGISTEVCKAKDSSEERRSKTRPKDLSTRTDVNKLTKSKETKISCSDIAKILNIANKRFGIMNIVVTY